MTAQDGMKAAAARVPLLARLKTLNRRMAAALLSYLVLGIIATFTLDGFLLWVVILFFALLAVKTVVHSRDE